MTTKNELEPLVMFYFLPEDVKTLAFIDDIHLKNEPSMRKIPFDNYRNKEDGRIEHSLKLKCFILSYKIVISWPWKRFVNNLVVETSLLFSESFLGFKPDSISHKPCFFFILLLWKENSEDLKALTQTRTTKPLSKSPSTWRSLTARVNWQHRKTLLKLLCTDGN